MPKRNLDLKEEGGMNSAARNLQLVEEGKRLAKAGSYKAAEQILTDVVAKDPENAAAWHELGTTYWLSKDFEKAATAFLRRFALEPQKTLANYSLALALIELKRTDEARMYLTRALRLDPGYTAARKRLAEIASVDEVGNEGLKSPMPRPEGQEPPVLNQDRPHAKPREPMSKRLMKGDVDPGNLLTEGKPLARNYLPIYIIGALLSLVGVGLLIILLMELQRRHTMYRIYEGRIDVQTGFFSRTARSAWAFEIIEVGLQQSFLHVLTGTAAITLKVEGSKPIYIHGLAPAQKMKELFETLRDKVLAERRDLKGQWV
jgi:tetratricopeptide (TPR) repeat protein